MPIPHEIYMLDPITDNPLFEGFGCGKVPSVLGRNERMDDFLPAVDPFTHRDWYVASLKKAWKPLRVSGRVRPFNDYPAIGMLTPAFSSRAIKILQDDLSKNGELLLLDTRVGDYYAYNLRTVVDAVDTKKSIAKYLKNPPTTAVSIKHFVFHKKKLNNLSIFRLADLPNYLFVTDSFKRKVESAGLLGFHFVKIWPFPPTVDWLLTEVNRRRKEKKLIKTPKGSKAIKGNSIILTFELAAAKPSAIEKKLINAYKNELDAQLVQQSIEANYFGSLEGSQYVADECWLFLSCPDADRLLAYLTPWLKTINWPHVVKILLRYGNYADGKAPAKFVNI